MLVQPCSACGRPRPFALMTPPAPCPSCKSTAPPSPEVERAIAEARAAVLNLPLRDRQLQASDELVREVEIKSHSIRWWWAGFAFPLALAALVGLGAATVPSWSDPDDRPDMTFGVLMVPFVIHAACGWSVRRWMKRLVARVRSDMHARPARDGSYECRLCGGPLPAGDLDAPVIVCRHCRAQNILDASATAVAVKDELVSFEVLRRKVTHRASLGFGSVALINVLVGLGPATFVLALYGRSKLEDRLTKEFRPDSTIVMGAYREDDRGKRCLSDHGDEKVPLAHLVGRSLHYGDREFVLAAVGRDGFGRVWLESNDGRWSRGDNLCWRE